MLKFILAVVTLLFLFSCSKPPRMQLKTDSDKFNFHFKEQYSSIKGGGNIFISVDGERYTGSADVKWENTGTFSANFYSPFGSVVASVQADSVEGTVFLDGKEYMFGLDQAMDSLPFGWGRHITFRQFVFILTGQIPKTLVEFGSEPDSIVTRRRDASAIWAAGQYKIDAVVNRKTVELDRVSFSYSGLEPWKMQFSSFKRGLARSVEIEEDDKNYFIIRYERLRPE